MKAIKQSSLDIPENAKNCCIMRRGRSKDKLANNVNSIRDIWVSNGEVDKTPNQLAVQGGVIQRCTIRRSESRVGLKRCATCLVVCESCLSEKIRCTFSLRKRIPLGGRSDFKSQKLIKLSHVFHFDMLVEVILEIRDS